MQYAHQSVLLHEVTQAFDLHKSEAVYLDCTLGAGGHTEALLKSNDSASAIAIERDQNAIDLASRRLVCFGPRVRFLHGNFGDAVELAHPFLMNSHGFDGVIADLGVSSMQLDDPLRGMSFKREASMAFLDMRMDCSQGPTAKELIAMCSTEELANIIFEFGEERYSRKIARSIKEAEANHKLETAGDLRHAVYQVTGGASRHARIDPATRTFQALRIAVNDELRELDRLLQALPNLLAPSGIAAIISFHSLEDRRVKHTFANSHVWKKINKKPIVATDAEILQNPRARSAKLRVAQRLAV